MSLPNPLKDPIKDPIYAKEAKSRSLQGKILAALKAGKISQEDATAMFRQGGWTGELSPTQQQGSVPGISTGPIQVQGQSVQGKVLAALKAGKISQGDATAMFQQIGGTGKLSLQQQKIFAGLQGRDLDIFPNILGRETPAGERTPSKPATLADRITAGTKEADLQYKAATAGSPLARPIPAAQTPTPDPISPLEELGINSAMMEQLGRRGGIPKWMLEGDNSEALLQHLRRSPTDYNLPPDVVRAIQATPSIQDIPVLAAVGTYNSIAPPASGIPKPMNEAAPAWLRQTIGKSETPADVGPPGLNVQANVDYVPKPGGTEVPAWLQQNYGKDTKPIPAAPTPGQYTPVPDNPADPFGQLFNLGDIPQIGDVDLGTVPQISGEYSPGFDQAFWRFLNDMQGGIGRTYDDAKYQDLDTALLDQGQVPQPKAAQTTASTPQMFDQLSFLLSGQGFKPDVMSKLRSTAVDDISQGGIGRMSQAKRALAQAGMGQSGAAPALQEQIARETQQEQGRALNQIDIQNAERGLENLRMGTGLESGRRALGAQLGTTAGLGNMQQANMMAIQNAANMLTALRDNASAQNTSNQLKFEAETRRRQGRAQDQSQNYQTAQQQYLGGKISGDIGARSANAANQMGMNLNRAQLQRQRDMFNVGTKEGRWSNSLSAATNVINQQNPAGYYSQGGTYQPNMTIPQSLINVASGIANQQILGRRR